MSSQNKIKIIQNEIMNRRAELIQLQQKQGGVVSIKLLSDNLDYVYNTSRQTTKSNPSGEKFYLTGVMIGQPIIINESDILLM